MAKYRLSHAALHDIEDVLRYSQAQFGSRARGRYQELIRTAIEDLALAPDRVGSSPRDELAEGLRSFHLIHVRQQAATSTGRVQKPRHVVFYRLADDQVIEIVRILHDAMEVRQHLTLT
ncbi:type II toxin-antitoxin system RelE/ParE family toxin [Pseudomonas fuscovaginae UPB0736]|uniref:type II toxin-antitoxin system RelE/ParE family toxin n=1 Tax=Pseudomonas asplenii TaxID=53407 RepID=UPI00028893DC|nr:type II toxin-antitoxin system RelE/ParE family toxin [Pseudomonas fuscovaginae]UUQ64859.1 type II toxin-antitoxin system RelE/ParE family toxin [Pseudomonas fuscovaginae UPB0736]